MKMKKFLDQTGISVIWSKIENNYPTNEDLTNVINAIDETKADKADLVGQKVSNGEVFNDYTNNIASGDYSHAEGEETIASGKTSHAEGIKTIAKGYSSHAEGGIYGASNSNPEGWTNTLTASDYPTFLTEDVIIYGSIANGNNSHAEGGGTYAHGEGSHAEGNFTLAMNYGSHSEGYGTQATGYVSHAEGYETKATQQAAHAEGYQTKATGKCAHAEGEDTEASGYYAHAEGHYSKASGYQSHAEGSNTKATASCAHAEGYYTEAAQYSHSEGGYTKALGNYSHAEGYDSQANGEAAHAEGQNSQANGMYSHTEGYQTKATTYGAHAEGYESEASGSYAHAEGFDTQASGFVTHAEGCYTRAIGQYSHAEGEGTVASSESQHVQGKYNIEDTENKYAHIVGNGTSNNEEQENPSNAHTLDWEGNAWFAGDIKIGGTNYDEGFSIPYAVNPIVIPAGRMYGDINGDGFIDIEDYKLFLYGPTSTGAAGYMNARSNQFENEVFPIDYACANISKNGQRITSTDLYDVLTIANNSVPYGYSGNDYTGNYIVNPNYETEEAQFYTDINLSSISTLNDIIISITSENIDSSIFVKAEIIEEAIRIWVKRPPISNIECLVTVINDGSGKCSITGGDFSIYTDHIDKKFSDMIMPKTYIIPAGRMYGDINGDGFVDDNDLELFKDVYNNTENYTGTEEAFLLSDFNKSGTITPADLMTFKNVYKGFHGYGGNDYTGNYIVNPNYQTEEAQFYTDILVEGLTPLYKAIVQITPSNIDTSMFTKVQTIEGAVRLWVTRPPISNIECVINFNPHLSNSFIIGGNHAIYADHVKSQIDTKLNQLNYKKYTIPAGRMYGDINGDGFIDEVDRELIVEYFNMTTEDYEEVPLDFYLSDITHDGVVDYDDFTPYSLIINNGKGYGITGNDYTGNYIANPNYSTEKAQFYTDVTVADITSTCNVSVEIATYDVDSSIFVKAEPIDGAVRIWVTRPPISAVDCLISFNEGEGIGTISGGDSTIYVDNMSYEKTKNKATEINEDSTDEQYPSAKAVYTSLLENKPYMTKITLTTSGWDVTTLTQIATIEGIKADETAQAIYINPINDATMIDMIANCNVRASAQGENSLTFSCDTVPSQDLEFYVKWEDVKYIS